LLRQADPHSLPIPLAYQLRTDALKPDRRIEDIRTEEEWKGAVRSVVEKRRDLIHSRGEFTLPKVGDDLCKGRVLVYAPGENVADGASEYASSGFVDLNDAPLWDTWVAHSDRGLVTWVPQQLVVLAQRGIDVNAVDCIKWFD